MRPVCFWCFQPPIDAPRPAVEIFAVIKTPGKPDEMLIVRQFRPPLMKDMLELPAGLVDAGETCSQAALRELKEETGAWQRLNGDYRLFASAIPRVTKCS